MMNMQTEMLRAAIHSLLEATMRELYPKGWTVQGFGMLRCYLDAAHRYRLNIWDGALAVPNASVIHNHPWDLKSLVISGCIQNITYEPIVADPNYLGHVLKTGEGGGPTSAPFKSHLKMVDWPLYQAGQSYEQFASVIHESKAFDGTVTLNDRTKVGDGEHATVYWPIGTQWVDAAAREASQEEIHGTVAKALALWK